VNCRLLLQQFGLLVILNGELLEGFLRPTIENALGKAPGTGGTGPQ
jgi:hypothetical protein